MQISLFTRFSLIAAVVSGFALAPSYVPAQPVTTAQNAPDTEAPEQHTVRGGAVPSAAQDLFPKPANTDSGWQGLANLLEALSPGTDTSLPLSPSQITDRIAAMITNGQYQEALDVIARREAQLEKANSIGTDVQLRFLRARAHSGLGEHEQALAVYQSMTSAYPELPEPWNNLAAEYVQLGRLDMARDALDMALAANPGYAPALANMGRVQLMLAERAFRQAEALGQSGAGRQAEQTRQLLN